MRFEEVARITKTFHNSQTEELREFINQNCQDWESKLQSAVLYRGMAETPADLRRETLAFVKPIRTNRRPRDSSLPGHALFQHILAAAGAVAHRENSAMVSRSESVADQYGWVWRFVPVGPVHYTWAKHVDDWTQEARYLLRDIVTPKGLKIIDDSNSVYHAVEELSFRAVRGNEFNELFDQNLINQIINADRHISSVGSEEIMISADAGLYIKTTADLSRRDK